MIEIKNLCKKYGKKEGRQTMFPLEHEDDDKQGAFELHFIYVDPDFLRMGIGTEMLRFFEQKGKEKGCREFVVWVLQENEMGRNFYEKNGYHPDGKEKIFKRWNQREIRYVKG